MNEVETEFATAIAMARHALEQFRREPIVPKHEILCDSLVLAV